MGGLLDVTVHIDAEGGQEPSKPEKGGCKRAWKAVARPLPAIDASGVGWYAIIVSLLSTVALIILADKANKLTIHMNESSHMTGLTYMATADPTNICVNGSLAAERSGTWTRAQLICMLPNSMSSGGQGIRMKLKPLFTRGEASNSTMSDVHSNVMATVAGLEYCGAIRGYYTQRDLLRYLDQAQTAKSPGSHTTPVSDDAAPGLYQPVKGSDMGDIRKFLAAAAKPSTVRDAEKDWMYDYMQTASMRAYNVTSPSTAVLRAIASDYVAAWQGGEPVDELEINSRLYMPLSAKYTQGMWGWDVVMRVAGAQPAYAVWLHIRQDEATTECLQYFIGNVSNASEMGAPNCTEVFVGQSYQLMEFKCLKGVEASDNAWTAVGNAEQFMTAAKRNNKQKQFLSMKDLTSDDVYAIYTGALGSVFAAVAVVVATGFLLLVVLVWRALSPKHDPAGHGMPCPPGKAQP